MGKKISVDSANLMNKVFEVIEACKFFKFNPQKYRILIHPQSYVHSIVRLNNGLIKMILYNADMTIPISNILCGNRESVLNIKNMNIETLNKLKFEEVDDKRFPSIKLMFPPVNFIGFEFFILLKKFLYELKLFKSKLISELLNFTFV